MKIKKWTLKSPITASVCADFEFMNSNNGEFTKNMDFNSRGAARLLDLYPEIQEYLTKELQIEDLIEYADFSCTEILRIEFGDWALQDGLLWHICNVYTKESLEELPEEVLDFIQGQLSDGWGEGMEQNVVHQEKVETHTPVFDDMSGFYQEETTENLEIYLHYWNCYDFSIEIVSSNVEEVDWCPERGSIVFSCATPEEGGGHTVTTIYKFFDLEEVLFVLRNSCLMNEEYLVKFIEEHGTFGCAIEHYLVIVNKGLSSYPKNILGIVDRDLHKEKIYQLNTEDGTVSCEEFEEGNTTLYANLYTR